MMPTRYPERHQRVNDLIVITHSEGTPTCQPKLEPGSNPRCSPPQRGSLGDTENPLPPERMKGVVKPASMVAVLRTGQPTLSYNGCTEQHPRTIVGRPALPAARSRNPDNAK